MTNFMNWLGQGLQTPGSVVFVSSRIFIVLVVIWIIWSIAEHIN